MSSINWKERSTKNNYPADQVISALQKDIRRGNVNEAVFWAYEFAISGEEYHQKLWERLTTIAAEDIGLANINASVVVQSLRQAFYLDYYREDDKHLQAMLAAAYLATSKKDRFIDEIKNYFVLSKGEKLYDIPDYAIDKHTKVGREMGRGDEFFWKTSSKLSPEDPKRNREFLVKVLSLLKIK